MFKIDGIADVGTKKIDWSNVALAPLENFRVGPMGFLMPDPPVIISIYLEGFLIRKRRRCDCPSLTLLESGCQCGGI